MNANKLPRGVRLMRGKLQISYQWHRQRYFETLDLRPSQSGIQEAARVRRQRIEELRAGTRNVGMRNHTMRFADVAQRYLDSAEIAPSTRLGYRDALNRYWMPFLADRNIDSIKTSDLRAVDRDTAWPSTKTRKNALSAMRQVFRYALDEDLAAIDPSQRIRVARAKTVRPGPDPYSMRERDALLAWLEQESPSMAYAYFFVAFHSGMRTGELLALRWTDFDGESLSVNKSRVRRQLKSSTKTYRSRRVLVPPDVCRVIRNLPSRFRGEEIFLNQYDRPYVSGYHLNQYLERAHAATRVRRRVGPYPWRHTYASIGLTKGARPAFLAKQLGHTLQVFYSTYARWIESDDDRKQLEIIAG